MLRLFSADKWQTPGLKARLDNCSKVTGAEAKGHASAAAELSGVTASPVPEPAPVFPVRVPHAGLWLLLSRSSRW